jgi:hypothetical protein
MGFHSPIRGKRPASTAPQQSRTRSLFASRPFDPEPTEEQASESHSAVQKQPAASPFKPINFAAIPLYSPAPAASATSTGAIQRQESTEPDEEDLPIQAKLAIGQPNDPYEQEADRVASNNNRSLEKIS